MNASRPSPLRLAVAVLGAVALTLTTAAVAQQPSGVPDLFVDRVDVDVVNVEVVVVDRDGNRVPGLGLEDFELYEDGERVEISNFYAAAGADRVLSDLEGDREMVRGDVVDLPPVPEDQRLYLLVYVDHYNLRPESQKNALTQIRGFLVDRLFQGDRVMLMGYDGALEVVTPFTDEVAAVEAGLGELARQATHRQVSEVERRSAMRLMRQAGDAREAIGFLRSHAERARHDVERSAGALATAIRTLSGLPGRKALVYVSEGLPQRPAEDLYFYIESLFPMNALQAEGFDPIIQAGRESQSGTFADVVREAQAAQATLFTVDASGPSGRSQMSAEWSNEAVSPSGRIATDQLRDFNVQEPLIELADATGGRAVLQTANLDETLAEAARDFDVFYSLGYRPRHGGDGKRHDIRVEVKRPGLRARHRGGYVDKPEVERVADRTLSSLYIDAEANPLGVAVDFGAAEKAGRNRWEVPVLIRVPVDQLTFLPQGGTHEGRLKFFVIARNADGDTSQLQEIPYALSLTPEQLRAGAGKEIGYATKLLLRRGTPRVAVGVWDELSGVESFVHKAVIVGDRG